MISTAIFKGIWAFGEKGKPMIYNKYYKCPLCSE